MTTDNAEPDVASIARMLTKAQRAAIMDPASASNSVRWRLAAKRDGGGADWELLDWDAPFPNAPKRWFCLPLGLRVRQHLIETQE